MFKKQQQKKKHWFDYKDKRQKKNHQYIYDIK